MNGHYIKGKDPELDTYIEFTEYVENLKKTLIKIARIDPDSYLGKLQRESEERRGPIEKKIAKLNEEWISLSYEYNNLKKSSTKLGLWETIKKEFKISLLEYHLDSNRQIERRLLCKLVYGS